MGWHRSDHVGLVAVFLLLLITAAWRGSHLPLANTQETRLRVTTKGEGKAIGIYGQFRDLRKGKELVADL